jgi:hypothetical protein
VVVFLIAHRRTEEHKRMEESRVQKSDAGAEPSVAAPSEMEMAQREPSAMQVGESDLETETGHA